MRWIVTLVAVWTAVSTAACAPTVLETEHQAALKRQQTVYETRLKSVEEALRRGAESSRRDAEVVEREKKMQNQRIAQLEDALADKQRLLDDVSTQLIGLQDAFSQLSARQRKTIKAKTAQEQRLGAEIRALQKRFETALAESIQASLVKLQAQAETLRITFGDGALFSRGSTRLNKAAKKRIERLAKGLEASPGVQLRLQVHSDNVRPGGAFRDTWAVTGQQGLVLVRALQKQGVDPSRLSYRSMGHFGPIATNDTPEGRDANRRVVVELTIPGLDRRPKPK